MILRKILIICIVCLSLVVVLMGVLIFLKLSDIPMRDYNEIRSEGVLRIVTEYDPSGFYRSDDRLEGFHYELCRAIAQKSGLEVQLYPELSMEKSFAGLRYNQYDVIARNIPTVSELKEHYLFTDPLVLNKQVLVQRTAESNNGVEPVRDQLDLAKKTLHIPENSPAILRLHHLQHEIGDTIYIVEEPLYSSEQLVTMVAKGDIEFAVCDQQTARTLQKQLPEIDFLTDISFTQLQAWAVRKTSPVLLDSLNQWFNSLRENGDYDRIYRKYYSQN